MQLWQADRPLVRLLLLLLLPETAHVVAAKVAGTGRLAAATTAKAAVVIEGPASISVSGLPAPISSTVPISALSSTATHPLVHASIVIIFCRRSDDPVEGTGVFYHPHRHCHHHPQHMVVN